MHCWINHHGLFIRVIRSNFFIHLKQIAVFLTNHIFAVAAYGIPKIQINRKSGFAGTFSQIALFFGVSGSYIPGNQVSEAGIFAFQKIIPI